MKNQHLNLIKFSSKAMAILTSVCVLVSVFAPVLSAKATDDFSLGVSLTKSVDKVTANPGDEIVYTLNYQNESTTAVFNVKISDPFTNAGQEYLTFINSEPFSAGLTWNIGTLQPGQSGQITIRAQISGSLPAGTTVIQNRAFLAYSWIFPWVTYMGYSDYVSTKVDVCDSCVPCNPKLLISKSVDKTRANAGDEIVYTVNYEIDCGTCNKVFHNVVIKDPFNNLNQNYLTFISANPAPSSGNDTWNLGDINTGQSGQITIRARISDSIPCGDTGILNKASIDSNETDIQYSNDVSTDLYRSCENPAPTCSISANPSNILNGQYSVLSWTSTNATSCIASNAWSGAKSLSGTQSVSPSSTSTYALTCTGSGGTVNCSAPVTVNPIPTLSCSIAANPNSGTAPLNNIDLTATVSGTATGTINYTFYCNRADSGTNITYPYAHKEDGTNQNPYTAIDVCSYSSNGIYTGKVIVERSGLAAECRTSVTVTDNPAPTCSISADPSNILNGQYSVLSWTSTNATSCIASNAWSGTKSLFGTQYVAPSSDGTYTLNCSGPGGSVTCSTPVYVREENHNPDLTIDKTVRNISNGSGFHSSVDAEFNDEIEFSLEIRSTGDAIAENVKVWDDLPSRLTYISGSTRVDGSYRSDGIVSGGIYIGDLDPGEGITVKFKAEVDSEDEFSSGTTTLTNHGYTHADNVSSVYDTALVRVTREYNNGSPALRIDKLIRNITSGSGFSDTVNAKPNDEIEFSIMVSSTGTKNVENVKVWDNLPSGLTYISGSTTIDGSYRSDGIVSGGIYIGSIFVNQTKEIRFRVKVSSSIPGLSGGITINVGTQNIQSSTGASISKLGRNISQGQTDWSSSVTAYLGNEVEFSIQIINNTGSDLTNVKIKESLPTTLSLITNSTNVDGMNWGGDITGAGLNLGTITRNQTKTIKYRVTVIGGTSGGSGLITLTNTAYANGNDVAQVYDDASAVITGGTGEVLGVSVVTGSGFLPSLAILFLISCMIAFMLYCQIREDKVLDYLNKENGNKFFKFLIRFYFKVKLMFKLAFVRFKKVYF